MQNLQKKQQQQQGRGFLSGATEKGSTYQMIANSNTDDVTAICDQEPKDLKLAQISAWEE